MAVLTHWVKVIPATAGAVLVGTWATPAQAFFPSNLPDLVGKPVTTVPVPPPNDPTSVNVPQSIPIPPSPPPPFVPQVPPTINKTTDTPVPPSPPCCCNCDNKPSDTPEPATLVSGLIGLGVAGIAARARRRTYKKA